MVGLSSEFGATKGESFERQRPKSFMFIFQLVVPWFSIFLNFRGVFFKLLIFLSLEKVSERERESMCVCDRGGTEERERGKETQIEAN